MRHSQEKYKTTSCWYSNVNVTPLLSEMQSTYVSDIVAIFDWGVTDRSWKTPACGSIKSFGTVESYMERLGH